VKKKTTEEQMALAGTEEGQILAKLSERVDKAVQVIKELRRERDELKAKLAEVHGSDEEVDRLKSERTEIRSRIETILSSLEGLEESD
jgi:FtsZ-binding cell division protein ZapB